MSLPHAWIIVKGIMSNRIWERGRECSHQGLARLLMHKKARPSFGSRDIFLKSGLWLWTWGLVMFYFWVGWDLHLPPAGGGAAGTRWKSRGAFTISGLRSWIAVVLMEMTLGDTAGAWKPEKQKMRGCHYQSMRRAPYVMKKSLNRYSTISLLRLELLVWENIHMFFTENLLTNLFTALKP